MGIRDAFSSAGKYLQEIFDPRITNKLKKTQVDSLREYLVKNDISPDSIKGFNSGIKLLTDPRRNRDNPLLQALEKKMWGIEDEAKILRKQKSELQKELFPEEKRQNIFRKELERVSLDREIYTKEKELRDLLEAKKYRGFKDYRKLDITTRELEALKDKRFSLKESLELANIEKRKFNEEAPLRYEAAKDPMTKALNKKEEVIQDLKSNIKFDPEDMTDRSVMAEATRTQEKLNNIGKRRLITGGLLVGGMTAASNLLKESSVLKSRLNSYLEV